LTLDDSHWSVCSDAHQYRVGDEAIAISADQHLSTHENNHAHVDKAAVHVAEAVFDDPEPPHEAGEASLHGADQNLYVSNAGFSGATNVDSNGPERLRGTDENVFSDNQQCVDRFVFGPPEELSGADEGVINNADQAFFRALGQPLSVNETVLSGANQTCATVKALLSGADEPLGQATLIDDNKFIARHFDYEEYFDDLSELEDEEVDHGQVNPMPNVVRRRRMFFLLLKYKTF